MKFAEFINKQLRSVSMYKGISFGLSGIWGVALILSFFDMLGFAPLPLIVSMLVFVGITYLTSELCGLLFNVKPHAESSYITGLILALIFTPSLEISQLVVFAFIAMIAGASKFVVTLRGRHIFNPAAFGAAVIGLTGLGAASWWVATPILTPIVLAVVAMSLYQSKRFALVGVFLAITVPALIIQFLLFGADLPQSLILLLSWPILFLAGIMLTEPLTLPPRKWQMYIVAAVVAIGFVAPIQIGSFHMTPALALIAGNIVAAVFAARYAITLSFKKRVALTPTTDELIFTAGRAFRYEPGQYVELTLPHKKEDFRGSRRSFSVTSLPNTDEVSFGIKFYEPSSSFKKTLKAFEKGATVRVTNLGGDFVLPKDVTRPLLFVAGGIGITPFISHLRSLEARAEKRDIVIVYTVNSSEEIAYKDVLEHSGARVIIVSPDVVKGPSKAWLYLEGSRIDFDALKMLVPDINERWAYASGPVPFVQNAKYRLRKLGVRAVKSDYFSGY